MIPPLRPAVDVSSPPNVDGKGDDTRALTVQMLEWIGERRRSYSETLEAWKTSCPRLTIWEDAIAEGLVRVQRGEVVLTAAGHRLIDSR